MGPRTLVLVLLCAAGCEGTLTAPSDGSVDGSVGGDAGMDASTPPDDGGSPADTGPRLDAGPDLDAGTDVDAGSPVDSGMTTWPAPSMCSEGTTTPVCADGVAESSCGDQVVFFSQRAMDEADAYWSVPKPAGGFRLAGRFARGHAYLRLEVFSKPDATEVFPQVCFWRWDPAQPCTSRWTGFAETCASRAEGYSAPGTHYFDLGTPDDWWQRPSPAWSYGNPFDAMRIMHFAEYMGVKELLKDRSCGSACWPVPDGAAAHMPIDAAGELIIVAEGATLAPPASWSDCTVCP